MTVSSNRGRSERGIRMAALDWTKRLTLIDRGGLIGLRAASHSESADSRQPMHRVLIRVFLGKVPVPRCAAEWLLCLAEEPADQRAREDAQ